MPQRTPVKILLVDDTPANLLALEAVLQGPDYILVSADSGPEAIRRVQREDFAAILLDIQMPQMDGYETARRIKLLPKGRNVPIMFVTAVYKEDEHVRRGYEAGALDYFAKPIIPEIIKAKVQIYADLYRMTRQAREHERLLAAIKDRQAAEKALGAVLETVSEGVIITDAAGNITRTNQEAQRIWGGSKAAPLRGRRDFRGWWADTGQRIKADEWAMPRALKGGAVITNEPIVIRRRDGTTKTVVESASPLEDEDGKIIGAVVVMKVVEPEGPPAGVLKRGQAALGFRQHPAPGQG